jgi:hypothetical protein
MNRRHKSSIASQWLVEVKHTLNEIIRIVESNDYKEDVYNDFDSWMFETNGINNTSLLKSIEFDEKENGNDSPVIDLISSKRIIQVAVYLQQAQWTEVVLKWMTSTLTTMQSTLNIQQYDLNHIINTTFPSHSIIMESFTDSLTGNLTFQTSKNCPVRYFSNFNDSIFQQYLSSIDLVLIIVDEELSRNFTIERIDPKKVILVVLFGQFSGAVLKVLEASRNDYNTSIVFLPEAFLVRIPLFSMRISMF